MRRIGTGPGPREDRTRRNLVDAAITLFGRRAYDCVTTIQLAAAAGANQSSIRYHFGGKDGLYRAALEQIASEIRANIDPRLAALEAGIAGADNSPERLRSLARALAESWARAVLSKPRTHERLPFIMRELTFPSKHFDLIYERFYRRFLDPLSILIAALNNLTVSDPATLIRAHVALHVLTCFIEAEVVFWRQMGWKRYTSEHVEQMIPTLCDTFVDVLD